MDTVHYIYLGAWFRDFTAIAMVIAFIPAVAVALFADRSRNPKAVAKATIFLMILVLVLLPNNKPGLFPNRWPAVFVSVVFLGVPFLLRRARQMLR